jgi:hypothetical protein
VGLETPEMSENNIPHIVDTGASIMPHESLELAKRLWVLENFEEFAKAIKEALDKDAK